MRIPRVISCAAFALPLFLTPSPAGAIVNLPATAGVAGVSLKVAGGVAGAGATGIGVAAAAGSTWGVIGATLIGLGGVAIGVLDPPSGTFYDGSFNIRYDGSQFDFIGAGWMGDWGADASLPAFPLDPATWDFVVLQPPASGLTTSLTNDPAAGVLNITFDWGASGHAVPGPEPFNLFGYLLQAKRPLSAISLGNAASPPPDANFYVASAALRCSLPNDDLVRPCGEATTEYYRVTTVPEPGAWALMLFGFAALGIAMRRRRSRSAVELPA